MSLFTIDVSTLLHSPIGTMEEFQFSQELPADIFEDIVCVEPLDIHIKLIRQDYGIQCLLCEVRTTIDMPSNDIKNKSIEIINIAREFHIKKMKEDADDIWYINDRDGTVDLADMIRQELMIAGW